MIDNNVESKCFCYNDNIDCKECFGDDETKCDCPNNDFDCKNCWGEYDEVFQVSDWSQKYKLAIYAVSGIVLSAMGLKVVKLLEIIAKCQQYN